jgi:hypothetical protein
LIEGLNESVNGNSGTGSAGVEHFSNDHDFLIGKGVLVFAQ